MLSFRAVFNNHKNNCVWDELDEFDLTWYDDPSDAPFELNYFEEGSNSLVAWTEHLIRFHDWILENYSKGYTLFQLTINIYRDHDQTQDEILFSMSHFCDNYSNSISLIQEALRNYCCANNSDLKFIDYVSSNLKLFNRLIIFQNNWSHFLVNDLAPNFGIDEINQLKAQAKSLLNFPYKLYATNESEKREIIKSSVSLLKEFLKYFNHRMDNEVKRAKDSTLLLMTELEKVTTGNLPF
ncbi:hypothetical protein [Virgibacillus oceani]|uniref:Uncharacterized protein n=1 Tax=Virgibacillus oceani TaxID=1479511 RepID=A0A917LWC5_9BACI|nr:hypothetical protein [Virgibacillus oceani]GGG61069.1 hypothetical protein GCM10011398_00410 [Virgibacillus oceani]